MSDMIFAITGHANIEKALGMEPVDPEGQHYNMICYENVYLEILCNLNNYCDENNINFSDITLVSGMARGVDEIFALIAIHYNLKLILSIPASVRWHKDRQLSRGLRAQAIWYDDILAYKGIIKIIEVGKNYNRDIPGTGNYPLVNLARNQNMVDICTGLFCYRVSNYDSTGTDDCIKRGKAQNKFLCNLRSE